MQIRVSLGHTKTWNADQSRSRHFIYLFGLDVFFLFPFTRSTTMGTRSTLTPDVFFSNGKFLPCDGLGGNQLPDTDV
jgi:hypothetical protein